MFKNEKTVLKARELAKALQESSCYKAYELASQANDEDTELQEQIGRFNLAQMNLDNERHQEQPSEEMLQLYASQMQQEYQQIMANPNMLRYQRAVEDLNSLMTLINGIIAAGVNGEDPDQVTEDTVCTHDCSTCGGCL